MANRKKTDSPPADSATSLRIHQIIQDEKVPDSAAATASEVQLHQLECGLKLFREHRFAEARRHFEEACNGPQLPVTRTARNHIAVCGRRLEQPVVALQTAEDHYNYGIERLNARDLSAARKHLEIALALRAECDYMQYAYAAALALSGDPAGACENLRRAIECDPRNRTIARQDPDFAAVVHHPLFVQLLHPEKLRPF